MSRPTLHYTIMPNGMYKIKSKGQGTLLYKTREQMLELVSWDDYDIVEEK